MKPSKPSATPNLPSGRRNSDGSWKIPEPADVLSYSYLWAREAEAGEESGRKDRPTVVVVATSVSDGKTRLLVAPVTHARPQRDTDAIEIPRTVKRQLGLDSARSWIVLSELNRFIWPGPDIRLAPGHESPFYDAIPDWLFFDVRDGVVRRNRAGKLKITKRTE